MLSGSLAASSSTSSSSGKPSPILLPERLKSPTISVKRVPGTEAINFKHVDESELRAALIAKLQANKYAAVNIAPKTASIFR